MCVSEGKRRLDRKNMSPSHSGEGACLACVRISKDVRMAGAKAQGKEHRGTGQRDDRTRWPGEDSHEHYQHPDSPLSNMGVIRES